MRYIVYQKKVNKSQARYKVWCQHYGRFIWVTKNQLKNPNASYLAEQKKERIAQ